MTSTRINGTPPAQVDRAHNTETRNNEVNTPVSPLCCFTDAVIAPSLSGRLQQPATGLSSCDWVSCGADIRGDGSATLAAAAVVGALLQRLSLLQCSDLLDLTTAGDGVIKRVAAIKYLITHIPLPCRGDGARMCCYGGNGIQLLCNLLTQHIV